MKYTALEILKFAEVSNPNAKLGKERISIGGISVRKADHIINTQDDETVEVIISDDIIEVALPEQETHSKGVATALKAKSEASNEARAAQVEGEEEA